MLFSILFFRIVEILLKRDISIVNDEDETSNTPLHLAALEGHSKVVQILLTSGAAVDARLVCIHGLSFFLTFDSGVMS